MRFWYLHYLGHCGMKRWGPRTPQRHRLSRDAAHKPAVDVVFQFKAVCLNLIYFSGFVFKMFLFKICNVSMLTGECRTFKFEIMPILYFPFVICFLNRGRICNDPPPSSSIHCHLLIYSHCFYESIYPPSLTDLIQFSKTPPLTFN